MTKRLALTTFSIIAFAGLGCSTAKTRVMPGEDGVNHVISRDIERDGAEEAAMKEARSYCEDRGKEMVVVKEDKTAYEGSMDEETRKNIRNASKVAIILGGPTGVATDNMGVGGVMSGAGTVGVGMTSDRDYKAEFTFKCR